MGVESDRTKLAPPLVSPRGMATGEHPSIPAPPPGAATGRERQASRPHAQSVSYPSQDPHSAHAAGHYANEQHGRHRGLSLSSMRSGHAGRNQPLPGMAKRSSRMSVMPQTDYNQQVADLLDVVDPEVSAMTTLTDVQNSLFVPNFGAIFERAPSMRIPGQPPRNPHGESGAVSGIDERDYRFSPQPPRTLPVNAGPLLNLRNAPQPGANRASNLGQDWGRTRQKSSVRQSTIREQPTEEDASGVVLRPSLSDTYPEEKRTAAGDRMPPEDTTHVDRVEREYLVLPKDLINWDDWSEEEKEILDDYVRHLLHSRKERLRRTWRGFCHYVRTPLGAFVVIYASLLTFWGAAWIVFIIGWIGAGDRQDYYIEICDQILTALFCVVGLGLAPFRAYDTYHMFFIVKYHRKILRLRKARGYPDMQDPNDIPVEELHDEGEGFEPVSDVHINTDGSMQAKELEDGTIVCATTEDLEAAHELHHGVLTHKEYASFLYHQHKFGKSHTFYRPHESVTHRAFPLDLMIVVILMLDFHSCFQIGLGSLTWSVSYHHDWKHKVTAVILSISISVNIAAGLVIAVGNNRTRKKAVIERLLRQAVTKEALMRAKKRPQKHPIPVAQTEVLGGRKKSKSRQGTDSSSKLGSRASTEKGDI